MSGHSKWHGIKHKKGLADKKRGTLFSKLVRLIQVAARDGGDPGANFKLRLAIDKAKAANVPHDKIETAIKKGTGEIKEGVVLEEVIYEAYGPGGVAVIIEGTTDNKQRTTAEIKSILSKNNGRLGEPGSVRWAFPKKGVITVNRVGGDSEKAELAAIDAGAEDTKRHEKTLEIYTKPEELDAVKKNLAERGLKISEASIDFVPKNPITIEDEKLLKQIEGLMGALDESEEVSEIYSNLQ